MGDQEIVDLIKDGNELGFVKLANKYENLLYYIARGILGNRTQDVEECVNDTYLKFWNNIDNYDISRASIKTYMKVIVRNTAINRLRDLSRHESNHLSDDLSEIAKYYIDNKQDVEEQAFNNENLIQLNRVIRSMEPDEQEIIIRKYFYLQSSKHIAKAMDMTVSAVDSKMSRTRKKLKKKFYNEEYIT